jgi:CxxC motif-containing protein (DUF1111 family)
MLDPRLLSFAGALIVLAYAAPIIAGIVATVSTPRNGADQATGKSTIPQLSEKAHLYSDLAIHQMGPNLDDGVSQGQAKSNEFRTAPLWGLGKRIFFLHDGRTSDLVKAIEEHRGGRDADNNASEANAVVKQYNKLPETAKQDLLNFLRSL